MPYFRVSLGGVFGSTGEVWSVNPNYAIEGEVGVTWDQGAGDAALVAISAIDPGAGPKNIMSTACNLSRYRLELRSDQNELLGLSEHILGFPITGSGTPTKPPQAAAVLSLRTNTPGPSGRGRLYWPALSATLGSGTLRMVNTQMQPFVDDMAEYLQAVGEVLRDVAVGPPFISCPLIVKSKTRGLESPVIRVQAGDVVDTQRRRRDKLTETYYNSAYPPA